MQELKKILGEIDETIKRYGKNPYIDEKVTDLCYGLNIAKNIINKHMNDGWICVEKFGVPVANEHDFRFWITVQYKNGYRRTFKATWNYFDKCFVHQNGRKVLEEVVAYKYYCEPEPYGLSEKEEK